MAKKRYVQTLSPKWKLKDIEVFEKLTLGEVLDLFEDFSQ